MVSLTHEERLLQEIGDLAAKGKIQSTVGLTAQDAETKIQKLISTTRQRVSATKFSLDLMERMDFDFYLAIQDPSLSKSETLAPLKHFINFSDNSSFDIQIELWENNYPTLREVSSLIVFFFLNGFFSNLVSLEDCIAKIINIVYDLSLSEGRPSYIRQALNNKVPNGDLTRYLRAFHAIGQDGKPDKTGSLFNIAKEIRNQLTHDDIDGVVISSSPISLSGSPAAPKLHFHNSFFPSNAVLTNTEMIAFCQNAYDEAVNFVDECYRLICANLQQSGVLPIE